MKRIQPTLTGDAPAVTWPALRTGRQFELFDAMHEAEATNAATRAAYIELARRSILADGGRPRRAIYDVAGNCTTCGEAGRCPGYHAEPTE